MPAAPGLAQRAPAVAPGKTGVFAQLTHGVKVRTSKRRRPKSRLWEFILLMAVKDQLKRFIARNPPLEKAMYHFYRARNGRFVQAEIERRRHLSLFDYQQLAEELPYGPDERVIDNNMYGYAQALKNYAGIGGDLRAYMEHGLFLGGIVHPDQYHWHFSRIITMSAQRKQILARALPEKEALAVGPYIHYAQGLLTVAELKKLKTALGRTLLVFPFHSMKNVRADFAESDFLTEIKRVARDFDSVLISMYYLDARAKARCQAYEAEGFKIVTAGHRFDRAFVNRQRSHLELADFTMSNGVGTHTGYCIYLKKPHYIFHQEYRQQASSKIEAQRLARSTGHSGREKSRAERNYFSLLFGELRSDIRTDQYEAVADFWGFEDIKSPAELLNWWQT